MSADTSVVDTDAVVGLAREVVKANPPGEVPLTRLMGAWYDAGLAWVHFPRGLGGLDAPRSLQSAANRVLREAGGPEPRTVNTIGYGIVAGTIVKHASPEFAARLLRPLATGEELWCQLFSEPGAGSDLAGLATQAVREGDDWVVTGQKVWTSLAHRSRWAVLLARTDPDVPKHQGLTYFVVDLHSPGIEIRRLRQLTGRSQFNEVFLDGVRIPDSRRLGEVGAGWRVSMGTLGDERGSLGDRVTTRGAGAIGDATALWRSHPERRTPVLRARLARLWLRSEAQRLTIERAKSNAARGALGAEMSVTKLAGSELTQEIYEFCMELLGPEGTLYESYDSDLGDDEGPTSVQRKFLRARAATIEGGTSEIQRNVIAERILRLPQGPRQDKGVAWRDIRRS
jgi:alkylation response protein AidB-like acyl-CoA dehydrogenase